MANGAISAVLWPGAKAEVGDDLLNGGILAFKTGYHGPRYWMQRNHPDDYSIQLPADKLGPGELGSAIDLTFKSAQGGDFRNIAKYSRRLLEAGQRKDPRAYPLREFQGNIDSDRTVEGWSFYRDHAITTSDTSHLWHIHLSIWRKYINDAEAMRSILSIWNGDDDVASQPTTLGVPLMANAVPIRFDFDNDQLLTKDVEENVWVKEPTSTSIVAGDSTGIDIRATIAVSGLKEGESVRLWFHKQWKKTGEADVHKGSEDPVYIIHTPGVNAPSAHFTFAGLLAKADTGWTAAIRITAKTNSETAVVTRRQIRGWKLDT